MVLFNLLTLNLDTTNFIHFKTRNSCSLDMKIAYDNRLIINKSYTKFLGITTENTLYWKNHKYQLLPKLSAASYAIRVLKPFIIQETLVMVYYDFFHSLMNYGITFWGTSPKSINIFRLQKKAIRIITSTRNRDPCTDLLTALHFLPLQSQYTVLLLCFAVMHMYQYKVNLDIHSKDTRQSSNLHQTTS
jgi:hypothetical protein